MSYLQHHGYIQWNLQSMYSNKYCMTWKFSFSLWASDAKSLSSPSTSILMIYSHNFLHSDWSMASYWYESADNLYLPSPYSPLIVMFHCCVHVPESDLIVESPLISLCTSLPTIHSPPWQNQDLCLHYYFVLQGLMVSKSFLKCRHRILRMAIHLC